MVDEQLVSTLARKFRTDVERAGSTTPVSYTATASTDNITATAHGLSIGDAVVFSATAGGLTAGTTYYVVAVPTSNTFKVSATVGGTAVDISADIASGNTFLRGAQWLQVRGISDFKPTIDSKMEDDSDYDSDGWSSSTKTGMGWKLEMTLQRKVGITSRAYDPGQEAIRAAADQFGPDSVVHVRWYDREGGLEAYEGYASVEWSPEGGEYTALDKAKTTLNGQGARTVIANPVA